MKRKVWKVLISTVLSSLFLTQSAFAGFQGSKMILGYDVGDTQALIIKFDTATSCGGQLVLVPASVPYYKDMLSIVIAAYSAGKPVNVWIENCGTNGQIPQIVRMYMGQVW